MRKMKKLRKLLPVLVMLLLSDGIVPARAQTSTTPDFVGRLSQADLHSDQLNSPPSDSFDYVQTNKPRLYASGEYLIWWLHEGRIPAVLTTSSFATKGELGQPDTRVLYGDQRLETRHDDRFVGGRF